MYYGTALVYTEYWSGINNRSDSEELGLVFPTNANSVVTGQNKSLDLAWLVAPK